ncbi:Flp family type IVb pilin [Pseudarthrobacter sp. LT1]|jgi:pilus assembly protein Flp/PilA|uniref:Flp family type IVb pilin n=1 Tax=Pseudarthrobacter sp. LT1 TaxID=3111450 RepID=UPI002D7912A8|nr:Flp family type IVb pilin [Pseudarthrobacter sp. LT1]WRT12741.1 Flp family type IVb pilin [Pseudarthrobacter sp. LT1]
MKNLLLAAQVLGAWLHVDFKSQKGATATEYSLLVGLIALVLVVGVGAFGGALNTWFSTLGTTVSGW